MIVNNYISDILQTWKANMDIQYIVDAYACVMYVVAYVMKDEKEMGHLLKRAAKESRGSDIKKKIRQLGNTFLTHREVSAQEAVYRVLSLPLRMTSRTVTFINNGMKDDWTRISQSFKCN